MLHLAAFLGLDVNPFGDDQLFDFALELAHATN